MSIGLPAGRSSGTYSSQHSRLVTRDCSSCRLAFGTAHCSASVQELQRFGGSATVSHRNAMWLSLPSNSVGWAQNEALIPPDRRHFDLLHLYGFVASRVCGLSQGLCSSKTAGDISPLALRQVSGRLRVGTMWLGVIFGSSNARHASFPVVGTTMIMNEKWTAETRFAYVESVLKTSPNHPDTLSTHVSSSEQLSLHLSPQIPNISHPFHSLNPSATPSPHTPPQTGPSTTPGNPLRITLT